MALRTFSRWVRSALMLSGVRQPVRSDVTEPVASEQKSFPFPELVGLPEASVAVGGFVLRLAPVVPVLSEPLGDDDELPPQAARALRRARDRAAVRSRRGMEGSFRGAAKRWLPTQCGSSGRDLGVESRRFCYRREADEVATNVGMPVGSPFPQR